jgi:hypothetical protein
MGVDLFMKIPLKFDANGNFKIVQFTDIHEGPNKDKAIELMNKILDYEKPNMVVLTGDNIDGKCQTENDVKNAISNVAEPIEKRNVPWAIVFGNHDDEHNMMNKEKMMEFYMTFSYNISQIGYKTFDRIGNYNLLIESSKEKVPKFNIYMLDSGKYAPAFIGGYDWIKATQICWYKKTASNLKKKYNGIIPSLMFFHIPLKKFKKAWDTVLIDGDRFEDECSSKINLCIFNTIVKTGDVKGIFSGHDHLNNYCAALEGIRMGYAGYTGYETYGRDNIHQGARVFLINENDPVNFRTWISKKRG